MTSDPKIGLLRTAPGLSGYRENELARLAPLVDEHTVEAGEVLTREGSPGRYAFLVVEGEAAVTVSGRPVRIVGPGELIGEMSLLDENPRSATVTAITAMRVLTLDAATFETFMSQPGVARRVAGDLARRLREVEAALDHERRAGGSEPGSPREASARPPA